MAFRIKERITPKKTTPIIQKVDHLRKVEGLNPSMTSKKVKEYNLTKARTPKLKHLTNQFIEAEKELKEFQEETLKRENHLKSKLEHMEKLLMDEIIDYDGVEIDVPGGKVEVLKSSFSRKHFNQNLFRKENPDLFKKYYEVRTYPETKVVRNTIYDKPIDKMLLK